MTCHFKIRKNQKFNWIFKTR